MTKLAAKRKATGKIRVLVRECKLTRGRELIPVDVSKIRATARRTLSAIP
jgi:hypothetical protein